MNEELKRWIEHMEAVRPEMDALAQRLASYSAIVQPEKTRVIGELPYLAQFQFEDAVTTVRFLLKDHQNDPDAVVTNMTTLPREQCGKGHGSRAVQALLRWATDNSLNEVRATQVGSKENEQFWQKNGFARCPEPNPCNDFVRTTTNQQHQPT